MTQENKRFLPLSDIETDQRLQVRTDKMLPGGTQAAKGLRLDEQHHRLVNILESGSNLEPVKVIKHKESYLVFDGHHRLKAYEDAFPLGNPEVPVEVLSLSYREALAQGFTVNANHGEGLHVVERSQAALRSCIYSNTEIKAKELKQKQGVSQSLAEKITRAARLLKQDAKLNQNDSPRVIDEKISVWISTLPRPLFKADGKPLFKLDDHGFPSYRFILERKVGRDIDPEKFKVEKIAKTLEAIIDEDYDAFRKALKKVAHVSNRNLQITMHRIEEPQEHDEDEF
jgi:hypothetical protein